LIAADAGTPFIAATPLITPFRQTLFDMASSFAARLYAMRATLIVTLLRQLPPVFSMPLRLIQLFTRARLSAIAVISPLITP